MADSSTVTLLFTELHDRLGDDAVDGLRRQHFTLLSDAVKNAGGREVKRMGDGIMAVFSSAVEAIGAPSRAEASSGYRSAAPGARVTDAGSVILSRSIDLG